jgi:hypothetical protein
LTPEHFDMKSLRQFDRSALCWALDSWAAAGAAQASIAAASNAAAVKLFCDPMALPLPTEIYL